VWNGTPVKKGAYQVPTSSGSGLLIATQKVRVRNESFLVEVGASLAGSERLLHRLLVTCWLGLPAVLGIVILGAGC